MKITNKILSLIIAALMIISAPVQTFAAVTASESFSHFGDSIKTSIFGETTTEASTDNNSKIKITTYCNSAKLQFDKTYLSYRVKEYNLLLDKWEDVEVINNSDSVLITELMPNSYHQISVKAGKKDFGTYSFYTRPENISEAAYNLCKENITLSWSNPNNYFTEIYKKSLTSEEYDKIKEEEEQARLEAEKEAAEKAQEEETTEKKSLKEKLKSLKEKKEEKKKEKEAEEAKKKQESEEQKEWELIDTIQGCSYEDTEIEEDNYYYYKLRYVCKNQGYKTLYSPFYEYEEMFVPVEINNILEANGYIMVRQNDPLNSTLPYPYKDNGKKLGSSGCGACASLMIVRNMTKYEPKLESYVAKLVEIGARAEYGTDIDVVAKYLHEEYKLNYSYTKDVEKLKKHLKAGNMAIAHVGKNKYFARAGHFVVIAGIVKDKDKNERAVILDPTFAKKKYDAQKRVDMGIEYSDDGIVTAPFETVLADCKCEYFTLFEAE